MHLETGVTARHLQVAGFGCRLRSGQPSRPPAWWPARISHRPSTAHADLVAVKGRTPCSRLDVVSATPSPSSGPCLPSQRHLDALATNGGESGEKCGLTPVWEASPLADGVLALGARRLALSHRREGSAPTGAGSPL